MAERLTQTVDIETPELVVLSYTIAGLGSRVYAALIDLAITVALMIGAIVAGALLSRHSAVETNTRPTPSSAWALAVVFIAQFVVLWGYYLLFEGLSDGQTPGKRILRLRAVRDGGYSVGFSASAVRNLMRIIDLQPAFTYLVGITSIALTKSGKRLGDIVAGTIVVREALVKQPVRPRNSSTRMSSRRPPHSSPTPSFNFSNDGPSDGIASSQSAAANSSRKSRIVFGTPFPPTKARAKARSCSDCSP